MAQVANSRGGGISLPAININIELAIPATDDPKVYDNLFSALRKNLFPDL